MYIYAHRQLPHIYVLSRSEAAKSLVNISPKFVRTIATIPTPNTSKGKGKARRARTPIPSPPSPAPGVPLAAAAAAELLIRVGLMRSCCCKAWTSANWKVTDERRRVGGGGPVIFPLPSFPRSDRPWPWPLCECMCVCVHACVWGKSGKNQCEVD